MNKEKSKINRTHIIGLVWQIVKYQYMQIIGGKTEDFLVSWANEMVAGKVEPIKRFSDKALKDSMFLINLCGAVEPRIVDWDIVEKEDTEEAHMHNAKYALSIARALECIIFNVWEDLVRPNPKAIMIYVTVMYQKNEEIKAAKANQ